MKRCKNCGWVIKPGYQVCEKCHASLEETAITEEAFQKIVQDDRAKMIEAWEENGGKKAGRLGCLIFFVIIASIIGLAFMSQMDNVSDNVMAIPLVLIMLAANLIVFNMSKNKKFKKEHYYDLNPPRSARAFCTQCGSELAPNEMFCSHCGRKRGE